MSLPRTLVVVIEYDPVQKRVMIRGVWRDDDTLDLPPPLAIQNQQNHIRVFENTDMKQGVGFTGLVPETTRVVRVRYTDDE